MSNATLLRGTSSFTAPAAKFGGSGRASGVFGFTGGLSFLASGTANATPIDGTGTMEGWVSISSNPPANRVAFGRDGWVWIGVNSSGKPISIVGATPSGQTPANTTVTLTSTGAAITDGSQHHLAIVWQAGSPSLYVDGTQQATSATVGQMANPTGYSGFAIGGFGDPALSGFDWPGTVDEVRISSTARYTGASYTVPTSAFTVDANTINLFHLDGDANDAVSYSVTKAPNDSSIVYSPYTWDVTAGRALCNTGGYFKTVLTGSPPSFALTFDVSNLSSPAPQVAYRLDKGAWTTISVAASVDIPIPAGTVAWSQHLLDVQVKATTENANRWSSPYLTAVKFTGISMPTGGSITAPDQRALKGLMLGDSITEGIRTIQAAASSDVDNNDARQAFAFQAAELLGAEVGIVGFGRQGVATTGNGSVPDMRTTYNLIANGISRTFTPTPDFVWLNAGTNDQRQGVSSGSFTTALTTLLNGLLSATPVTTMIFVQLPFGGHYGASPYQAAIAACSKPSRCVFVDTTGWWNSADSTDGLHPLGFASLKSLGPKVAAAVRTGLRRGVQYRKQGDNSLRQISPVRV